MRTFVIILMTAIIGTPTLFAGDVTGKVTFGGKAPQMPRLRMDADRFCRASHKTPVTSEEVIVNKNGTLMNVLVYVKGKVGGKHTPPKAKALLDQKGCVYLPHVLALQTGQQVEILNSDNTLHNVHTLSEKNPSFNAGQPIKGHRLSKTFEKQETFRVKCDVHSWMGAYIGIFDHPYFSVTGDDGSFTLKGVPAGEYTIEAWHEKYGVKSMKVTVPASGKKTVEFNYSN